jgi:hypothetical protein
LLPLKVGVRGMASDRVAASVCDPETASDGFDSCDYSEAFRNRSAFAITETELKLIAALASIGLSSQ